METLLEEAIPVLNGKPAQVVLPEDFQGGQGVAEPDQPYSVSQSSEVQ
jgi:hypothetical protein